MNNVVWHKISDFDFPQPYKDVLIYTSNGRYVIGYYSGESDVYPWYDYLTQKTSKGKAYLCWCELPDYPKGVEN